MMAWDEGEETKMLSSAGDVWHHPHRLQGCPDPRAVHLATLVTSIPLDHLDWVLGHVLQGRDRDGIAFRLMDFDGVLFQVSFMYVLVLCR